MSASGPQLSFQKLVPYGLFLFLLWLAHALGYFVHEYAHSFTAWAFGYKANRSFSRCVSSAAPGIRSGQWSSWPISFLSNVVDHLFFQRGGAS
jgi:hypothetical protein